MLAVTTLLYGLFVAWAIANDGATSPGKRATKPNIVFILTDDQDMKMDSLSYMKGVQANLINKGALYTRHYCTVALCCPSRVNLWTGKAAHNTNVTDLHPPYGGYDKFIARGYNNNWLFPWMQQLGYSTYYVGKLMNSFDEKNYNKPTPNGFNGSDFLCGTGTYNYYNPKFQRNIQGVAQAPKVYDQYTTGLTFDKGMAFLDDARAAGGPFFLTMATVAPHNGGGKRPGNDITYGPVPEEKYAQLFKNAMIPQTANFNPKTPSGTSWLLDIDRLNATQLAKNENYYRQRLRALQSVDDLVNGTIAYLQKYNLLDNTYIIYSTDNGFHISQHRLFPGKNCPYEEDINIPLIIRGPGVPAGQTVNVATTHTDLTPTILNIAGASPRLDLDGAAVPLIDDTPNSQNFEHAQVEHWGDAGSDDEIKYMTPGVQNTTYKALRIMGNGPPSYDFYYSVWCSNQHELYDMSTDTPQMNNLYTKYSYMPSEPTSNPFSINRLESRLDALLLVLKNCQGSTCRKPWLALHPAGDVNNLIDALKPKYDQFYEQQQNRISFSDCKPGYIKSAEGPQNFVTYKAMARREALQMDASVL